VLDLLNGSNSSTVQLLQYKQVQHECDVRSADRTTERRIFFSVFLFLAFSFLAFSATPNEHQAAFTAQNRTELQEVALS